MKDVTMLSVRSSQTVLVIQIGYTTYRGGHKQVPLFLRFEASKFDKLKIQVFGVKTLMALVSL
jgi:hypothetical protein